MERKTVAVLFGGRSAEHEISIITALQAITAMDSLRYEIVPVYITPLGKWYSGKALLNKAFYHNMPGSFSQVEEVILLPDPSLKGLLKVSANGNIDCNHNIPIDIYFLAFHGQYGEDGSIQGLLEMADAAYTGCGVLASSVAMNKYHCKQLLKSHDIPVLPSALVERHETHNLKQVLEKVMSTKGLETFPLFVKPCQLGSSVGIGIANDEKSFYACLARVFKYDNQAIIEPCVTQLMEINVAVVEGDQPRASVVEIPVSSGQALTYEDKYLRSGGKKGGQQGMASLTRHINPIELDASIRDAVIRLAVKSFSLLGCQGVSRFDFIYDKGSGQLYFNEVNVLPGSLAYYLWEKSSPPLLYTHLIDQLLKGAEHRKIQRLALHKHIGFKALK